MLSWILRKVALTCQVNPLVELLSSNEYQYFTTKLVQNIDCGFACIRIINTRFRTIKTKLILSNRIFYCKFTCRVKEVLKVMQESLLICILNRVKVSQKSSDWQVRIPPFNSEIHPPHNVDTFQSFCEKLSGSCVEIRLTSSCIHFNAPGNTGVKKLVEGNCQIWLGVRRSQ